MLTPGFGLLPDPGQRKIGSGGGGHPAPIEGDRAVGGEIDGRGRGGVVLRLQDRRRGFPPCN